MKKIIRIFLVAIRNKYIISLLVFFIWLLVFDRNNLVDRMKYIRMLKQMESEKQYYLEMIEEDSKKLNELKTNKENLEKFAREQYLMKREDEDIFVVIEED